MSPGTVAPAAAVGDADYRTAALPTARISVVIAVSPAHHRAALLGRCLAGLARQTLPPGELEVVLIGDGVGLDPLLWPAPLAVRGESFATPIGVCRARNHGVRVATAALIAFLDAGAVPHSEWLVRLRDRLLGEGVAACGGTTRQSPDGRAHENRLTSPGYVLPCAGLGNALFRRDVLEEVGGFDETLDIYAEEPDLCWRVCLKGHRFVHAADALTEHQAHKSGRKLRLYGRAMRQLERKFGPVLDLSRRQELRVVARSYARAHGAAASMLVQLAAMSWGYAEAWMAEVSERGPRIRPIELSEGTLQAQRTIPLLNAALDGRRLTRPNHVLWWTTDTGCCVHNLVTRTRVELADVAAELWSRLMTGTSLDAVRAQLADEYDVAPETLDADIDAWLRAVLAQGLLVQTQVAA